MDPNIRSRIASGKLMTLFHMVKHLFSIADSQVQLDRQKKDIVIERHFS